jgi:predicted dehydrogenase
MSKPLQVGIIGASAERGWAKVAHVPAVQGLAGLDLGAVATRDRPSAERAAKALGARAGYGDPPTHFSPIPPSTSPRWR